MEEKNFIDIRRNFILASILFILFLLYWAEIKIEQILIFKFDVDGKWAIISPYWDIWILLFIFFLYTVSRYLIYWIDEIKKYQYSQLLLIDILKNALWKWWDLYTKITGITDRWETIIYDKVTIDNSQSITKNYSIALSSDFIMQYYRCPDEITDLKIWKNNIKFSDIEIIFKSDDIRKDFWPWFFSLVFRKEYSDFLWPLFAIFPILFWIIFRIISFIICF